MKRLWQLSTLGLALLAAPLGCGDDPPAAAPAPAPKPKAAAATATAAAAPTKGFTYTYNPLAKRDPFRVYVEETTVRNEGPSLCSDPLCQWDLEQLALRAVVSGDANPLAMAEDPGGVGHMIRRNTRIGKQGGKVTQILRDCIVVTEYWTGPDGKVNPNPVKVCIKAEETSKPMLDLMNPTKRY
jgi:type IV pilus assembly protein PilP